MRLLVSLLKVMADNCYGHKTGVLQSVLETPSCIFFLYVLGNVSTLYIYFLQHLSLMNEILF